MTDSRSVRIQRQGAPHAHVWSLDAPLPGPLVVAVLSTYHHEMAAGVEPYVAMDRALREALRLLSEGKA